MYILVAVLALMWNHIYIHLVTIWLVSQTLFLNDYKVMDLEILTLQILQCYYLVFITQVPVYAGN